MTARQAASWSARALAGIGLLVAGLLLLLTQMQGATSYLDSQAHFSSLQSIGTLPALGLAMLRALRSMAFDTSAFFSGVLHILVSFWPLAVIAVGGFLLLDESAGRRSGLSQE